MTAAASAPPDSATPRQHLAAPVAGHLAVAREERPDADVLADFYAEGLHDPGQPDLFHLCAYRRQRVEQGPDLVANQRHDQQDQQTERQECQQEHGDHREGTRQLQFLQSIRQRVADVGEQRRRDERRQYRREQVDEPAGQRDCHQPVDSQVRSHVFLRRVHAATTTTRSPRR